MNKLLFVYGTLRQQSQHPMARLLANRSRLIGAARVRGRLYDLGRFPGMLQPEAPEDWVIGEVVELDDEGVFADLDRYEDAEGIFPRQLATAYFADGREEGVWVYLYAGSLAKARRITSGDYFG